jgi:hypothetical protein
MEPHVFNYYSIEFAFEKHVGFIQYFLAINLFRIIEDPEFRFLLNWYSHSSLIKSF